MLFEEFQDDYLVDGHLGYLSGMIKAILGLYFAQFYAQEKIWVGGCCLKSSKMAVESMAIFDI